MNAVQITINPNPPLDVVIAELLAATEPVNRPSIESILAGSAVPEYDYQRLANLGLTSPLLGRQVRSIIQMAQHLIDGDVSPEGIAPSLVAIGQIIAAEMTAPSLLEASAR
ncbi:hypothetical protein B7R21_06450 [Subtercola boreus]|uniref:Uncharacterized protein n=1 Tax=Subtercola boreus TaxID=120213 RepID=A0A3E0VVZ0_9MICO|nr:hypothetical protein B7R21_06450 [Subtercola boreus]